MEKEDRRERIKKNLISLARPNKTVPVQCLADLWRDSFERPFRAKMLHWEDHCWFCVMGLAPLGRKEAYGYFDNGMACGFDSRINGWTRWKQL